MVTATQNRPEASGQEAMTISTGRRPDGRRGLPRSRVGGVWSALVAAAVVLLFLLIFVLQNGQRVEVSFLGANGMVPMGVALLLAAVFGVLLVALPGTARIIQLRMSWGRGDSGRSGPIENRSSDTLGAQDSPAPGPPVGRPTGRR